MRILPMMSRLKEGQKFFSISMRAYLDCMSMKLLSRNSLEVRISRSTFRGMSKLLKIFSSRYSTDNGDASSSLSTLSIAWLISKMLSQAKQMQMVIFVLSFVFSSICAKLFRISGKSCLSLPSKSPMICTLTLFFITMLRMLSLLYISESYWNWLLANFIRNSTSSSFRLKFSSEKAQKDAYCTPSSKQYSRHFLSVLVPSSCPDSAFFFSFLAYLRFPSIIKAICSGTCPFFKTLMASFSRQESSIMSAR